MALESSFQSKLIKEIEFQFPGAITLKNDANQRQGFPDTTILFGDYYAVLDSKRTIDSEHRINQDYYIGEINRMSSYNHAFFIYPENKELVLNELCESFRVKRITRLSRR